MWPTTVVIGLFEKGTNTDPVVSYLQHTYGDNLPIAAHDLEDVTGCVLGWKTLSQFLAAKSCGSALLGVKCQILMLSPSCWIQALPLVPVLILLLSFA